MQLEIKIAYAAQYGRYREHLVQQTGVREICTWGCLERQSLTAVSEKVKMINRERVFSRAQNIAFVFVKYQSLRN